MIKNKTILVIIKKNVEKLENKKKEKNHAIIFKNMNNIYYSHYKVKYLIKNQINE